MLVKPILETLLLVLLEIRGRVSSIPVPPFITPIPTPRGTGTKPVPPVVFKGGVKQPPVLRDRR